ncbi:MAG: hypothetical protein QXY36_01595 [Sulfolobales archaeon]
MLCEICEALEAVGQCRLCGRYVCSTHIGVDGICSICREALCRICYQRLSISSCLVCGRVVCRECSIELQPSIRVCRECYDKLLNDKAYVKYRRFLRRFVREWEKENASELREDLHG